MICMFWEERDINVFGREWAMWSSDLPMFWGFKKLDKLLQIKNIFMSPIPKTWQISL